MSTSSVLANPCPKRWEELAGDDRRRDCAACGKTVLAVAEMGLEEARAASKAGACLSFVELPGGLVRTREGWRLWRVAALAGALASCGATPPPKPPAPTEEELREAERLERELLMAEQAALERAEAARVEAERHPVPSIPPQYTMGSPARPRDVSDPASPRGGAHRKGTAEKVPAGVRKKKGKAR